MSGSCGIVTFDYATWAARYPELALSIDTAQAQGYFDTACLYVDNTALSMVPVGPRASILYLTTSHVAQLLASQNGQPASPLVGRISGAGQGSVNVTTELNTPQSAAWFAQTRYGLLAWQALAPYRTALYIPGGRPVFPGSMSPWGFRRGF
jgi:hypothetical protein